jgi:hypothetical protein
MLGGQLLQRARTFMNDMVAGHSDLKVNLEEAQLPDVRATFGLGISLLELNVSGYSHDHIKNLMVILKKFGLERSQDFKKNYASQLGQLRRLPPRVFNMAQDLLDLGPSPTIDLVSRADIRWVALLKLGLYVGLKMSREPFENAWREYVELNERAHSPAPLFMLGADAARPRLPAPVARLPAQVARLPAPVARLPAQVARLPAQVARLPAQGARLPAPAVPHGGARHEVARHHDGVARQGVAQRLVPGPPIGVAEEQGGLSLDFFHPADNGDDAPPHDNDAAPADPAHAEAAEASAAQDMALDDFYTARARARAADANSEDADAPDTSLDDVRPAHADDEHDQHHQHADASDSPNDP